MAAATTSRCRCRRKQSPRRRSPERLKPPDCGRLFLRTTNRFRGESLRRLLPAPHQVNGIFLEGMVGGEDDHLFLDGLRDEQAVEGIPMMRREAVNFHRMKVRDR